MTGKVFLPERIHIVIFFNVFQKNDIKLVILPPFLNQITQFPHFYAQQSHFLYTTSRDNDK